MTTITPLPTPPSRDDSSNFADRGDAFLGALPAFADEVNAIADEVNQDRFDAQGFRDQAQAAAIAASSSASQGATFAGMAAASANFSGAWSTLSGALGMPSSVLHDDTYWMLLVPLADVAAHEPGVDAAWSRIPTSAPTLSGPAVVYGGSATEYEITNYSSFAAYSVTVSAGSATITASKILFFAPPAEQDVTMTVTGNGGVARAHISVLAGSPPGRIGTQGGQGFGVGVCTNGSLLVALGLAAMTGTADPAHANYGNYQHSNGSIVCYVPKHFVRVGHASSPRYATYGANAHDVVGIETFANEAAANAAGYYMPRAFVNGDIELDGFFYDKYLASKDGTASCKSVFGGVPISLTTTAGYTVSNGMTGCTGIYADAVVLARARGTGWHCASVFQSTAVAILSLAHGQAATSTTHCAWYDAGGTTNFPKGCNNNALSDTNDGTVTWASAGDSGNANKPKTGATANFAKTTHNGQDCGIADVNGAMFQVLLGITAPGTSGTDTTPATTGASYQSAYVLKRSTDIATLTAGWTAGAAGTDAWGDAAHLAALYDQVSDVFPWTTSATTYFGNGSNQVFSGATSGRDYHRTACGIPKDASATGATGTSQFGNDLNSAYNRANLFVPSAGSWDNAANAGVFYRHWNYYRSNYSNYVGFRAAACG